MQKKNLAAITPSPGYDESDCATYKSLETVQAAGDPGNPCPPAFLKSLYMSSSKEISYKVNEDTGCWECISHKPDSYGYAIIRINGKRLKLHRHMFELHKGPIPDGLLIRHTCDNRICINPDHLLVGTVADNVNDCIARGRHVVNTSCCKKLTSANVVEIRDSTLSIRSLAKTFNVSGATVCDILHKKTWKTI